MRSDRIVNYKMDTPEGFRRTILRKSQTTGQPIDMTGMAALMHIRSSVNDPNVLATLSTADGTIVITGAAGQIDLHIPQSAYTALAAYATLYYSLDVFASGVLNDWDNAERVIEGVITLDKGTTR